MAVELQGDVMLISAHLPHKRLPMHEFVATLEEIYTFLAAHPSCKAVMGVDANARLSGMADFLYVGWQIPRATLTAIDRE